MHRVSPGQDKNLAAKSLRRGRGGLEEGKEGVGEVGVLVRPLAVLQLYNTPGVSTLPHLNTTIMELKYI